MPVIKLTRELEAVVDDEDFERLAAFRWSSMKGRLGAFYAARNDGARCIQMQREIMDPERTLGRSVLVDHLDHNPLNNRRSNLRLVSFSVSNINRRLFKNNSTGFRGVHICRTTKRFIARVKIDGVVHFGGSYQMPEDAARAYNTLARELHGENAVLNVLPADVGPFLDIRAHRREHGRGQAAAARTHCLYGHPLEGHNLIIRDDGRECRTCGLFRSRKWAGSLKAAAAS